MKYKNRFCNSIDQDSRNVIFEKFWYLNWDQKKMCITSLMKRKNTGRKFVADISRPSYTYEYCCDSKISRTRSPSHGM